MTSVFRHFKIVLPYIILASQNTVQSDWNVHNYILYTTLFSMKVLVVIVKVSSMSFALHLLRGLFSTSFHHTTTQLSKYGPLYWKKFSKQIKFWHKQIR